VDNFIFLNGCLFLSNFEARLEKKAVKTAGKFFLAQLALNLLWSPIFFGLESPLLGLVTIVAMWVLIVITMKKFYPFSKLAFYLLIPYLLWVSFATVLNAAILLLN
jgi:tryptophan-rich sensory protein